VGAVLGYTASGLAGVAQGGAQAGLNALYGVGTMALGAAKLISPLHWAMHPQENSERAQMLGGTLYTLGKLSSPLGWALDPEGNRRAADAMVDGATREYRHNIAKGDYPKVVGQAIVDVGGLVSGAGGANAFNKVASNAARAERLAFLSKNAEMLPSGAGMTKLDLAAERAYQRIRDVHMTDVQAVAENTGLSLQQATNLKKQLFFGRHEYPIDGATVVRARFAADHEIAYAWQAATKGPLTEGQGAWLNQLAQHELAERGFMAKGIPYLQRDAWTGSSFGTIPPGAHNLAPRPPSTSFPGYEIPFSLLGD